MKGDAMLFHIDLTCQCGTSYDQVYEVRIRGDRYGSYADISVRDHFSTTVWFRKDKRPVLEYERKAAGNAKSVIEWVVDNSSGTGVDRLTTLADDIAGATLGDLLLGFAEAYEAAIAPQSAAGETLVKVACRGNQRAMMEDRFGP